MGVAKEEKPKRQQSQRSQLPRKSLRPRQRVLRLLRRIYRRKLSRKWPPRRWLRRLLQRLKKRLPNLRRSPLLPRKMRNLPRNKLVLQRPRLNKKYLLVDILITYDYFDQIPELVANKYSYA